MADHQQLIEFVQPFLKGDETAAVIAVRLQAAAVFLGQKLDDETAAELAQGLVSPATPPPPPDAPATPPPPEAARPRLIVDWGDYPQLGHRSTPHFLLLCPDAYQQGRPKIYVEVDNQLDNDFPSHKARRIRREEEGLWGFHVPFSLTTNGEQSLPGHYVINVTVKFRYRDLAGFHIPGEFHCAIRLRIQDPDVQAERTLEIDGDGKSIINLQGQDLRSFGRVVLKGGDTGIINLHNSETSTAENDSETPDTEEAVTHTFDLKPDSDFEGPRPHLSPRFSQVRPSSLEMGMFLFDDDEAEEDRDPQWRLRDADSRNGTFVDGTFLGGSQIDDRGSRILLIPKQRVIIGRNRGIPIILRFLPRSPENDQCSLSISRDHMAFELEDAGLLVKDRGADSRGHQTGSLHIADQVVKDGDQHLLGPDQVNAGLLLELPYGLQYDETFKFEVDIFGNDSELTYDAKQVEKELTLLLQAVGNRRKPPLWRCVEQNGMEAVRLQRQQNLEEEQYILLYRKALIGNSISRSPIFIDDGELSAVSAQVVYLDRSFWLQNLGDRGPLQVEDHVLEPGEIIPLREGMKLQFGQTMVRFERAQQMHL